MRSFSPIINIPQHSGVWLLQLMNPQWHIVVTQSPLFTVHSWYYIFYGFGQVYIFRRIIWQCKLLKLTKSKNNKFPPLKINTSEIFTYLKIYVQECLLHCNIYTVNHLSPLLMRVINTYYTPWYNEHVTLTICP